jgi:hypothetical protein
VGGWVGGWVDGRESGVKDCLQQSKNQAKLNLPDMIMKSLYIFANFAALKLYIFFVFVYCSV